MCLPHSNPALVVVMCYAKKRKKEKSDFVACVCAKKISVLFRPRWLDKISGGSKGAIIIRFQGWVRASASFVPQISRGRADSPQERSKMSRKRIKNLWLAFPPPCLPGSLRWMVGGQANANHLRCIPLVQYQILIHCRHPVRQSTLSHPQIEGSKMWLVLSSSHPPTPPTLPPGFPIPEVERKIEICIPFVILRSQNGE